MPDDRTLTHPGRGMPESAGRWRWAIIRSELSQAERHVALTLGVRMDADGTIPSRFRVGVRGLATDAQLHYSTVSAKLKDLVAGDWLAQTSPAVGRRPANYRATVPRPVPSSHDVLGQDQHNEAAAGSVVLGEGGHNGPVGAVDNSSNPVEKPVETLGTADLVFAHDGACVGPERSLCWPSTNTYQQYQQEPATSSHVSTSGQGRPGLDDLDRVDRLALLRRARSELVDRGFTDPPIDLIHRRAHTLLDTTEAQA